MDANRLRSRVALYVPDGTRDAEGQASGGRRLLDVVAANVRYESGMAAVRAGTDASIVHASVRIRYRDDAATVKWVVHGATTFNVLSALPDENLQQWTDMVCRVVS